MDLDPPVSAGNSSAAKRRGKVIEQLPSALYRVELENQSRVLAHVSGRSNKDFLRLLPGDAVEVELSPLDPGRARVVRKVE